MALWAVGRAISRFMPALRLVSCLKIYPGAIKRPEP
jgi:hypothetical protein